MQSVDYSKPPREGSRFLVSARSGHRRRLVCRERVQTIHQRRRREERENEREKGNSVGGTERVERRRGHVGEQTKAEGS